MDPDQREGSMTREKLIAEIQSATKDGRLSCKKAHDLAETLGVSLQEIGAICNELKIKISVCQLGCF
jgi:hypothetical protein